MMLPAFARNSALTFFCAVLVFLFPGSPQPLARSSDDKTALQREALLSSQAPRASQAQPLGQTKTEKLANPLNDLLDEAQRDIDEKKRSEEHTSELQSLRHLVCRLLLE